MKKDNSAFPQPLSQALEDLVKEMGIDSLPEDKKNSLLIKMTDALLKRIFIETMEKLDDQGRDEYGEMMEKNPTPEEVESFFSERIGDYDELVRKTIVDFKNEITETK